MRLKILMTVAVVGTGLQLGCFAQSAAAPDITLEGAIARATANQPLILQAQAAVTAAMARVGQAQSAYYPDLSLSGSYDRLGPKQTESIPGLGSFQIVPENIWDFHAGVGVLVFQFGRRSVQVRLARSGLEAAVIGVDQITSSIAYQTAQVFYSILFLRDEVKELDEQTADLEEHLVVTRKRQQTGSATDYDVLSTQVRVAAVKSQRIDAMSRLADQKIALSQLMGIGPAEEFEPSGSFAPGPVGGDVQALVASALANRLEIRQALETEKAAELNRRLLGIGGLPSISVHAQAGYKDGILDSSNSDINALVFNWDVGVTVKVPIFDGFLVARQVDEASGKLEAARQSSQALRRSVATQVLQSFQDVKASRDQVENSRAQIEQAQAALDTAKVQYDIGVSTNLQYLDAQTSLSLARLNNLGAVYNEVLSQLRLKQALGERIWGNGG